MGILNYYWDKGRVFMAGEHLLRTCKLTDIHWQTQVLGQGLDNDPGPLMHQVLWDPDWEFAMTEDKAPI